MMPDTKLGFGVCFGRFAMIGVAVGVVLAALGYVPTERLGGPAAVSAMFGGIGISLVASILGAIPICRAVGSNPTQIPLAVLSSTAIRFLVVLVLIASAYFSGWFVAKALFLWVVISYFALLTVDCVYAARLTRLCRNDGPSSEEGA